MIDRNHVLHIARLARLRLTEEEVQHFTHQIGSILSYVDQLESAPTDGITPADTIAAIHDADRKDVVRRSLDRDEILKNGPQVKDDHFAVPKVIG